MRRLTGIELGILALAGLFIVVGAIMVIHPTEADVFHQAYNFARSSIEHVSREKSRIYGVLAMLIGAGMVWMVFYGRRK